MYQVGKETKYVLVSSLWKVIHRKLTYTDSERISSCINKKIAVYYVTVFRNTYTTELQLHYFLENYKYSFPESIKNVMFPNTYLQYMTRHSEIKLLNLSVIIVLLLSDFPNWSLVSLVWYVGPHIHTTSSSVTFNQDLCLHTAGNCVDTYTVQSECSHRHIIVLLKQQNFTQEIIYKL